MRAARLCPAPAWVTQLRVERRTLLLRIAMVSISVLLTPAIAANAGASCRQEADMAASRTASAVARSSSVVPAQQPDRCRAYSKVFFDAVEARQAASICADDTDRQRTLAMLDAKIDAFNNLIASECGSS